MPPPTIQTTELLRARWRRVRASLGCELGASDFASRGVARFTHALLFRALALPADPEADMVTFDEPGLKWLARPYKQPFDERSIEWGDATVATSDAIVRCRQRTELWSWRSYLALYRHGGAEIGMGDFATTRDGRRVFPMLILVARFWTFIDFYRAALNRYSVLGPWELTVALRETQGAHLGNFAEGWAEPWDSFSDLAPCQESQLLWRIELQSWPGQEAARDLALRFGSWLDNAWGVFETRAIARTGLAAGTFDIAKLAKLQNRV